MAKNPRAHSLAILGATALLTSCGVGKGAPDWIGADAAVVRCTVAGPNLSLPRMFDEVPSPAVPTGLYARTMDPIALDQLGFERDRAVCATLQAPDTAQLDAAAIAIDELHTTRSELSRQARKLGRCLCSYADALDSRTMVPGCADQPTRLDCELETEQVSALATLLAPLRAKLETTQVPRVHWRLFGRTDRIGRFVARYEDLLGRHPGGSEVYLRKTPLPPHAGMKLISALLAIEHVVAVVRQDGGRALLVVREIDDDLILDHFAYPDWLAAGARGFDLELSALLPYLDDAQIDRYRAALAPPTQTRELLFEPRKGYMVELDRAALDRVDRGMVLAARFAGQHYDETKEVRVLPPLLIDRFAHQVPYGTEGTVLRVRARLTDEGREWIAGPGKVAAYEALTNLGQSDFTPQFEPASQVGAAQLFLLRGRPIEQTLFAGATALPQVLMAIEIAASGSLKGDIDDFQVAVPSGPLPGELQNRPGVQELRERLSISPHELAVEVVEGGSVIQLELEPR
ncbi:hypothetical protein DB30_00216 [Enhygromyxa salina]|uniref:Lipoprotein n=1 Tax=Enhygromyxa salina TaxID=215803 RepID=A0A0C2D5S7_9BACT|nr:hypothetical protein [Enhygromyxa salina]KIG18531.1 hypothetical protein DB30_00216 [Enhygromyxa salina]